MNKSDKIKKIIKKMKKFEIKKCKKFRSVKFNRAKSLEVKLRLHF